MNESHPAETPPPEAPGPRPAPPDVQERRREPVFNIAGAVVLMIGLCALIHFIRAELLTERQDIGVLVRFAFFPVRYTGGVPLDIYTFVSPLTYSLLHGGLAHLVVNCVWLAAFGSPLAFRIGAARFLLFWAVTAVASVAVYFVLHPNEVAPLVGASGAISGMMGAAARFGFRIDRTGGRPAFNGPFLGMVEVLRSRQAVVFLVVWLVINLVIGLGFGTPDGSGEIAWEAHIGGLLAGFFTIRLFDRSAVAPAASNGEDGNA